MRVHHRKGRPVHFAFKAGTAGEKKFTGEEGAFSFIRLFDFYYRREIYIPRDQRQYGYSMLPVLQGEEFTGRIELAADDKEKTLEVKGYWPEKGKKPDKRALNRCLKEFAAFQLVQSVVWTS